jgi:tRNA (cmo5U34)-methyltransferase
VPSDAAGRRRWLKRYAAFATASGVPTADARNAIKAISTRLPLLAPAQDEALLLEAGDVSVELLYAGFSFPGWAAYTPA